MGEYSGRLAMWRGALLGSVSLVAISCASDARAACQGLDTANVLCDVANPSGGALVTLSNGDTIVNINAGAGITGGASFAILSNDNLTIHHNDPAGITHTGSAGIHIIQSLGGTGAISYTGSADVTGAGAGFFVFSDGGISITQTAGAITTTTSFGYGIDIPTLGAVIPSRSININTVGATIAAPGGGILIQTEGAQSDVTIATGAITTDPAQFGSAISVNMGQSTTTGRNLSVTTNGAVVGAIDLRTRGIGTVDLTTNALVTGGIDLRASNMANTNAFTVNLNQDVAGNVILQNTGTGTSTVRTRNITGGTLAFSGGGANSSLVVDGTITRTGIADVSFSGGLAAVSLSRGGTNTATFNGAISGTFDTTGSAGPANSNFAFGLIAGLGSTSADGSATLNANESITVTGIAKPGAPANVRGASLSSGGVPVDFNLHGAVSATSISDTASTVQGILATQIGDSTLRLTADGNVTATANAAGSNATGILASATASAITPNTKTYIVRANGDVTATSDGAATGISVTRGVTIFAGQTAGTGGADLVSKGTVTANSTSAAAIGVRGFFTNDATNAATLSLRTEGNVIANGIAAGSYGIFAQRGDTGDIKIDVLAGVQSTGVGIGTSRSTAGNVFITAGSNAAITGVTGITTSGGTTTLLNNGTITGTGGTAVQFGGTNDVLAMLPGGGTFNGNVVGNGSSILQLGGTTAANFDLSKLGGGAQFSGFSNLAVLAGANWSFAGNSSFAGTVNVDGVFNLNSAMPNAAVVVGTTGILSGTGSVGNTTISGTLSPGNSPGSITMASLTLTTAASYLVQVSGTVSDSVVVTGTANLAGQVVIDPLTRLTQRTTYTIMTAGVVNGTFSTANFLMANNFARNPVLSYLGNSVFLTLDPGLLSPVLSANATGNHKNVAGAIDNALLGGSNMSNAFSATFNLSGNDLLNGLTQLSGETATGSQQTTFNAMTQFMGLMTDPFIEGRGAAATPSTGATPYAEEETLAYAGGRQRSGGERAAYGLMTKAPPRNVYNPGWSVWAAAYGGSQATDGNFAAGSNNTTSRLFGVAAGADYRFSPNTIAGFALAGGGTSFSVTGGGSGRSDLFQAGAFVKQSIGRAYFSGALAYGWQDVITDRTVTVGGVDRLRAQFNATAFSGRAEGGYRFVSPWIGGIGITPYAAGQFTTFDLPAYAEQVLSGADAFALAYGSKSVTATRSELGLRADKSFALTNAILTLRGRAAWAHDFSPDRTIGATFQTLPGASFVVNGARQASDSALTTASAEIKWMNGWSATGTFEGEFSNVTSSYAGKGVVRYAW